MSLEDIDFDSWLTAKSLVPTFFVVGDILNKGVDIFQSFTVPHWMSIDSSMRYITGKSIYWEIVLHQCIYSRYSNSQNFTKSFIFFVSERMPKTP
jgi:hypothetical protein